MSTFRVLYTDGRKSIRFETKREAFEDALRAYPRAAWHDDGARLLVWKDLASSADDDGRRAVAEIVEEP